MKKELDDALVKDFPLLYADRNKPMQETCMCWGFACPDEWELDIRELSSKLEPLIEDWIKENPDTVEHPKAAQVKEKFGELRFYMKFATKEMYELVHECESKFFRS